MSEMAHFFVVISGSKIHERVAHFFIDIYINAGTITFYDVNGNTVEYWNNSL